MVLLNCVLIYLSQDKEKKSTQAGPRKEGVLPKKCQVISWLRVVSRTDGKNLISPISQGHTISLRQAVPAFLSSVYSCSVGQLLLLIHLAHNLVGPQLQFCFMTSALLHSQLVSSNSSPENLICQPSPWDVTFGMQLPRPMDKAGSLKRPQRSTGLET